MSINKGIFTSESVSRGHPDKVCDQISDAILDAFLHEEPEARLGCETLVSKNTVIVAGEYRGPESVWNSLEDIARKCVRDIGYEQDDFHWNTFGFQNFMHGQSADIAKGVDATKGKDEGAGDQGLMFGYAVNEAPEFMPAPLYYAHRILQGIEEFRKKDNTDGSKLGPDAKSQVTLRFDEGKPVGLERVVISSQHIDGLESSDVKDIVKPIASELLPEEWVAKLPDEEWLVNPTGIFVKGGPAADCGLTGRKIIVDTYGGAAPHGGGAFSGKDPTKVDRSATYAARYLAKNVVAAGLADKCLIQISYAIGKPEPTSLFLDTSGTEKFSTDKIEQRLLEVIGDKMNGLTPRGIREHLKLNNPIYQVTAAFGHFGRTPSGKGDFTWENTDLVSDLSM